MSEAEFTDLYPTPNAMPHALFDTLSPSAPELAFYSARDLDQGQVSSKQSMIALSLHSTIYDRIVVALNNL